MLFMNLLKARKCLFHIIYLIAREGTDPNIGGKIYVTTDQALLLYGSEIWVCISSILHTIQKFHHCACWRLADKKPRRRQNGTYENCHIDEATEVCGLPPIQVIFFLIEDSIS